MKYYKNTCIAFTTYTLSLYLLKMPLDKIQRTFFICNSHIPYSIVRNLPHFYYFRNNGDQIDRNWKQVLMVRLMKLFRWSFIKLTNIYAQDHQIYASEIIGHQKYTLMEDGPRCYDIIDKTQGLQPLEYGQGVTGIKRKFKIILTKSRMTGKYFGTNSQCIDRWITCKDDLSSPYIQGKKYTFLNYNELWNNSSEEKKSFIKSVFGIKDEQIEALRDADVMIFTQPFMEDCQLTEEEMYKLYADPLKQYPNAKVIIKPHPRDVFKYDKYFKNCTILKTFAPMQLISLLGINPKVAITVSSTAMSEMPKSTQRIYLGTKVHPKIYAVCGDQCNY